MTNKDLINIELKSIEKLNSINKSNLKLIENLNSIKKSNLIVGNIYFSSKTNYFYKFNGLKYVYSFYLSDTKNITNKYLDELNSNKVNNLKLINKN